MHQKLVPIHPPTIEDVKRQFEAWRSVRQPRQAIPAELWDAAACLCCTHRPYIVARQLRLNYTKLKEHAQALKIAPPMEKIPAASFVELDFGALLSDRQCVIEMKDSKGGKTTLKLKGDQCPDPVEICKAFWSRR